MPSFNQTFWPCLHQSWPSLLTSSTFWIQLMNEKFQGRENSPCEFETAHWHKSSYSRRGTPICPWTSTAPHRRTSCVTSCRSPCIQVAQTGKSYPGIAVLCQRPFAAPIMSSAVHFRNPTFSSVYYCSMTTQQASSNAACPGSTRSPCPIGHSSKGVPWCHRAQDSPFQAADTLIGLHTNSVWLSYCTSV